MGKSLIITTGGGTDVEEGSPNALPPVVLSGYTFYAKNDDPMMGEMENHSELSDAVLEPEEELIISPGYHSGEQTIFARGLENYTEATVEESELLVDYRGWNSGILLYGSMINQGELSDSLSANGTYDIPQGWHNGQGGITQSLDTQAATNITPGTTQKTVIAASKWTTGNQTVLGNGNLVAGNIKKNVTIFGVKGTYAVDVAAYYNQNPVWILRGTERAPAAWIQTRYWVNTGTWLGFLIFKFMWNSTSRYVTRVQVRVKLNRDIVIRDYTRYPSFIDSGWQLRTSADMNSSVGGNQLQTTKGYVIHDVYPNRIGYGFSDDFWLSAYQSVLNMQEDSGNYIIYWWQ